MLMVYFFGKKIKYSYLHMSLFDSGEWEIPQKSEINKRLGNLEEKIDLLLCKIKNISSNSEKVEDCKNKIEQQSSTIKKLENGLQNNKIMYTELLKMHKKFHLETKNILENYKKSISQQLENNNIGYKEIINVLRDNKTFLNKIDKLGVENKDIKIILAQMKKNNNKIKNNLSSAMLQCRNDNLVWRSYSNKFLNNNGILNCLRK